jgi:hypothetical protein
MDYGDISVQDSATFTRGNASTNLPVPFIGTFSRDISLASGTQGVTGIGFTPTLVLFSGGIGTSQFHTLLGADNGSQAQAEYLHDGTNTQFNSLGGTDSIRVDTSGSTRYDGFITSMDADGFTIDWTRVGAPTGTANLYFIAFK